MKTGMEIHDSLLAQKADESAERVAFEEMVGRERYNYQEMTLAELRYWANRMRLTGYSGHTKAQLIDALIDHELERGT